MRANFGMPTLLIGSRYGNPKYHKVKGSLSCGSQRKCVWTPILGPCKGKSVPVVPGSCFPPKWSTDAPAERLAFENLLEAVILLSITECGFRLPGYCLSCIPSEAYNLF